MPRSKPPKSPVPLWRPVKADPAAVYPREEVERSKSYNRPIQRSKRVSLVIGFAFLAIWSATHVGRGLVRGLGVRGWALQLLVLLAVFFAIDTVLSLPVAIWKLGHERRWEFSTQTNKGFAVDQLKNYVVNLVLTGALLTALFAVIRATRVWWLWGSVVYAGFFVTLIALAPTLQKVFNKYSPLDDPVLLERLRALAVRAGASISQFLVMDASKRTRKDNAFVGGLGKTRRVVIYDTMLDMGHDPIEVVIAHELGHWRRRHTYRGAIVQVLTGPLVLGVTALLLRWGALLRFVGAREARDPVAFVIVLFGIGLMFSVLQMGGMWFSRWAERAADFDSLELTGDTAAFRELWRKMPERNLPDLDPSWWERLKHSHPEPHERYAYAAVWEQSHPDRVAPAAEARQDIERTP